MSEPATRLARDLACRLCNKRGRNKKRFLFQERRDEKINSKIEGLLGIRLLYDDRLSNSICEDCLDKLNYVEAFYKCIIANQELMTDLIKENRYCIIPKYKSGELSESVLNTRKPYTFDVNPKKRHKTAPKPSKLLERPDVKACSYSVYSNKGNLIKSVGLKNNEDFPESVLNKRKPYTFDLKSKEGYKTDPKSSKLLERPDVKTCSYSVYSGIGNLIKSVRLKNNEENQVKFVETKKTEEKRDVPVLSSIPPKNSPLSFKIGNVSVTKTAHEIDITSDVDEKAEKESQKSLPYQRQNTSSLQITSVRSCSNEDHARSTHRVLEELHTDQTDSNDSDCIVIEEEYPAKKQKISKPQDRVVKNPVKIKLESSEVNFAKKQKLTKPQDRVVKNTAKIKLESSEVNFAKKQKLTKPQDQVSVHMKLEPSEVEEPTFHNSNNAIQMTMRQKDSNLDDIEKTTPVSIKQEIPEDNAGIEEFLWSKFTCCEQPLQCFKCSTMASSYLNLLYHLMTNCLYIERKASVKAYPKSLFLKADVLKQQCNKICIDEVTLLHKVDNEIKARVLHRGVIKEQFIRIADLTKSALVAYCKTHKITLPDKVPAKNVKPGYFSVCSNARSIQTSSNDNTPSLSRKVTFLENTAKNLKSIAATGSNQTFFICSDADDDDDATLSDCNDPLSEDITDEQSASYVKPIIVSVNDNARSIHTSSNDDTPLLDYKVRLPGNISNEMSANNVKCASDISGTNNAPSSNASSNDDALLLDCEVTLPENISNERLETNVEAGFVSGKTSASFICPNSNDDAPLLDCEVTCEDSDEDSS